MLYRDIPEDIINKIFCEYKLMPWISKSINQTCQKSNIYIEYRKIHVCGKLFKFLDEKKHRRDTNKYLNMIDNYEKVCYFGLSRVPLEYRTKEICIKAIKYNPDDIKYVPKQFLSKELCIEAFMSCPSLYTIEYLPIQSLSYDLVKYAIEYNPELITSTKLNEFLDQTDYGKELWKLAIDKYIIMLQCIPDRYMSNELCLHYIKINPYNLLYINEKYYTSEIINELMNVCNRFDFDILKRILQKIPNNIISYNHCILLLKAFSKNYPYIWNYIPRNHKDENLCIVYLSLTDTFDYFNTSLLDKLIPYLDLSKNKS